MNHVKSGADFAREILSIAMGATAYFKGAQDWPDMSLTVTRVPGGWLFNGTYVPYDDELLNHLSSSERAAIKAGFADGGIMVPPILDPVPTLDNIVGPVDETEPGD